MIYNRHQAPQKIRTGSSRYTVHIGQNRTLRLPAGAHPWPIGARVYWHVYARGRVGFSLHPQGSILHGKYQSSRVRRLGYYRYSGTAEKLDTFGITAAQKYARRTERMKNRQTKARDSTKDALDPTSIHSPQEPESDNQTTFLVLFMLIGTVTLIVALWVFTLFDRRLHSWIDHKDTRSVPLGQVVEISYVGQLGTVHTQVKTENRTLLIEGAVPLPKGTAIEWRRSKVFKDLCVVGSEHCWDLVLSGERAGAVLVGTLGK